MFVVLLPGDVAIALVTLFLLFVFALLCACLFQCVLLLLLFLLLFFCSSRSCLVCSLATDRNLRL